MLIHALVLSSGLRSTASATCSMGVMPVPPVEGCWGMWAAGGGTSTGPLLNCCCGCSHAPPACLMTPGVSSTLCLSGCDRHMHTSRARTSDHSNVAERVGLVGILGDRALERQRVAHLTGDHDACSTMMRVQVVYACGRMLLMMPSPACVCLHCSSHNSGRRSGNMCA